MERFYARPLAAAALSLSLLTSFGQGTVDIGLQYNTNTSTLDVMVRPTDDFDGIFSSLVFALRWEKSSDIVLGQAVSPEAGGYMNIARSGQPKDRGMFSYQVYSGFGFNTMSSAGATWQAGHEYTVLSIPVTGKGVVELVNDDWTAERTNNADYYVSLGGSDRTGAIYRSMVSTTDLDGSVRIQPNPNEGRFSFSFVSNTASDIRVDVLNTLGQSLFHDNLLAFEGTFTKQMDLTTMSDGIYYLKLMRGDNVSVHKIVYH